jgi:hypothetical protein
MEQVRQQEINEFMMITSCEDAGVAMEILSITNNLEVVQLGRHRALLRILRPLPIAGRAEEPKSRESGQRAPGSAGSEQEAIHRNQRE